MKVLRCHTTKSLTLAMCACKEVGSRTNLCLVLRPHPSWGDRKRQNKTPVPYIPARKTRYNGQNNAPIYTSIKYGALSDNSNNLMCRIYINFTNMTIGKPLFTFSSPLTNVVFYVHAYIVWKWSQWKLDFQPYKKQVQLPWLMTTSPGWILTDIRT